MATLKNRYNQAIDDSGKQGQEANDEYYRRATSYNPYEAVKTSAQGAYNLLVPELNRAVGKLRGQQVGMGRLNTGFATNDEDHLVGDAYNHLADTIASNSLQAAGLDLQNTQGLGSYASRQQEDYYDLLSGGLDREQAEENAKRKRQGGLFGTLGAVAGGIIGSGLIPGLGTAVGTKIGGGLGAELGGLLGNAAGSYF